TRASVGCVGTWRGGVPGVTKGNGDASSSRICPSWATVGQGVCVCVFVCMFVCARSFCMLVCSISYPNSLMLAINANTVICTHTHAHVHTHTHSHSHTHAHTHT